LFDRATGEPLSLEHAGDLGLFAAAGNLELTEEVALAMPFDNQVVTIDGDDLDWAGAPVRTGSDGVTVSASLGEGVLNLLVRSPTLQPAAGWNNVFLGFRREVPVDFADGYGGGSTEPGYGYFGFGVMVQFNNGQVWAHLEGGGGSVVVRAALGAGFAELAVPLCALSEAGDGRPVYLDSVSTGGGTGFLWSGAYQWRSANGWLADEFWGYRIAYPVQAGACGPEWLDGDMDGLTDARELELGTNPMLWDTDGDGYSDGQEVSAGTRPNDPTDAPRDWDGDGVLDGQDNCPQSWNPDQADRDGNGVGDACDLLPQDSDGDGVADAADNCPWTFNPGQADSDGNGVGDACQVAAQDSDGDGLTDAQEGMWGTDPGVWDSDGDGWSDGEEVARGSAPTQFGSRPQSPWDQDGDGVSQRYDADDQNAAVGGERIRADKWWDLEFDRHLEGGEFVSGLVRVGSPSGNWLRVVNPGSVTEIRADVIVDVVGGQGTLPGARVGGFFYKDRVSANGAEGDVYAGILLGPDGAGVLRPMLSVARCRESVCTVQTMDVLYGADRIFPGVLVGEAHTLSVRYDPVGARFVFGFDGQEHAYPIPADLREAAPPWSQIKGIGTRVDDFMDGQSGGGIVARFDNVFVNGLAYDDFSGLSIDPVRWADAELWRAAASEELALGLTRYGQASATNAANLNRSAEGITSLRSDVRVNGAQRQGARLRARVGGYFYRDTTVANSGVGQTGEVHAEIALRWHQDGSAPTAYYVLGRCEDADCVGWTDLEFGAVPGIAVAVGQTYTLGIEYDGGTSFSFSASGATVGPFDLAARAPRGAPSTYGFLGVSTRISHGQAPQSWGFIDAAFDNVFVNGVLYDDFSGQPDGAFGAIPLLGLEADGLGVAAWVTDGSGAEPAKMGHPLPWVAACAPNAVAYYYLASRDLVAGVSAGAGRGADPIDGFPAFTAELVRGGFQASDLTASFGVMTLGDDLQGVDWSYVAPLETRYYRGGTFTLRLGGEDLVTGVMPDFTLWIDYGDPNNCQDDRIWGESGYAGVVEDASAGSGPAVQAAASALLSDLGARGLRYVFDSLQPAIETQFQGGGRFGAYFEMQQGQIELGP
ncbi:MAG: thrombospondin type 3 repeat-containing protein, partial [Deferrisomatales bacterium]